MIKAFTVTNYLDESLRIDLFNPKESGFWVEEIEGLGPPKATISSTEVATADGSTFNYSRLGNRNIVLTLGFEQDPDIETVRQKSYKYFPIKRKVKLIFETDNRYCEIVGRVESNEPNIWSQRETSQISIVCNDPYFYSSGPDGIHVTTFSGVLPMFEFPFSNESVTEPLIELGQIVRDTTQTVFYDGDIEVGMVIYIHALGAIKNFTMYNLDTREQFTINTDRVEAIIGGEISEGDDIVISTLKNDKRIELIRGGITYNILNSLGRNSDWFTLSKGDNIFAYTVDYGLSNIQLRIENQVVYEGI